MNSTKGIKRREKRCKNLTCKPGFNFKGHSQNVLPVFQVPLLKFQPEEITIWSQLTHPNIVKLYGVLRRGQKIYFLEEFLDGKIHSETVWGDSSRRSFWMVKTFSVFAIVRYYISIADVNESSDRKNVGINLPLA